MISKFRAMTELDIDKLVEFNEELSDLLEKMDSGNVFSQNGYSQGEFKNLIASFIEGQRGCLGRTKEGSWSIVPNDCGMPSDARVEFILTPTYFVTAILSLAFLDYRNSVEVDSSYIKALKKGLLFCSYRRLRGHGYDADAGAAEALTILSMGKVPLLLDRDKSLCPELYDVIKDVSESMQKRLDSGTAYGMWGEDLQDSFSSALETMVIKCDKEMYEAIFETDKNSELYGEEDMPW